MCLTIDALLLVLTEFAEGRMTFHQWQKWWDDNSSNVQPLVDRLAYLRLKLRPMEGARTLLDSHDWHYKPTHAMCPVCGVALFFAIPGETTRSEIIQFARNSKLKNKETIIEEQWIHPGTYCSNGCVMCMVNLRKPPSYGEP